MREVLILCDVGGYPKRLATLREAFPGEVVCVCPDDMAFPHATSVHVPDEWLPVNGASHFARGWYAADALSLAAIRNLSLNAEFFWVVESDVCGPVEKWREVFAATAASDADGIFCNLISRHHGFAPMVPAWRMTSTPAWAQFTCLAAIRRLSRRAVEWNMDEAESLREMFCEPRMPSLIHRRGGKLADLREFVKYTVPGSFTAGAVIFRDGWLNHPVKCDT